MKSFEELMTQALALAKEAADEGEVPVAALVVDEEGRVIGRGANNRTNHGDPLGHAEVLALRQAADHLGRWNLSGCTLIVTLEPCPMCTGACIQARVGTIVFGAYDPKAGCCGSLYNLARDSRFNHRPKVVGGVMADQCAALLAHFFASRRKGKGPSVDG